MATGNYSQQRPAETSSWRPVTERDGARQCASADDKEESASPIAVVELEFATMRALEDSGELARALVAVRRGEVAPPIAEVDRCQSRLLHLQAHLLQPTPR